jgi:prepilin-type N-terminal cleavage/methylation domain-containing protein/prepilin-type processing-associated H-X9-DG protein
MLHARPPAAAGRHGFTLVELLVVIGIIAVLIGILLPSLNAARERGNTIKCLSNLRSLGQASATYTSQNLGYLLPADVNDPALAGEPNGRVWSDTWVTILVAEKFVPYTSELSTTAPSNQETVFHCPSGLFENSAISAIATGIPTSRKDAQGAMGYLHQSSAAGLEPGLNVFCWYGINGTSDSNSKSIPWRRITNKKGYAKANQIKNGSELAFLFDGILGLNHQSTNANRLNARHNNQRTTNVVFLDGHAESFPTKDLPGGDGDANPAGTAFSVANLQKYNLPKWRIDQ